MQLSLFDNKKPVAIVRYAHAWDSTRSKRQHSGWQSARMIAEAHGIARHTAERWLVRAATSFRKESWGKTYHRQSFDKWVQAEKPKENRPKRTLYPSGIDPRPGFIYAIICPLTCKYRYVGKAANRRVRWGEHQRTLSGNRHTNAHLQRWFNALPDSLRRLKFEVLQKCGPGQMDEAEQLWIAEAKADGHPLCNIAEGGVGGPRNNPEVIARLAEISRQKWQDPEYRERHQASMSRQRASGDAAVAAKMGITIEELEARRAKRIAEHERNQAINARNMEIAAHRKREREERKAWVFVPLTHKGASFIHLTRRQRAIVDAADWPAVGRRLWAAQSHLDGWRAKRSLHGGGLVLLAREIMGAVAGEMVCFKNGDQLDCRRSNLTKIRQGTGQPQQRIEQMPTNRRERYERRMESYRRDAMSLRRNACDKGS